MSEIMGTLVYTREAEGVVRFSKLYREQPDIIRLDILRDWIFDLQQEYDKVHKETFSPSEEAP